MKDQPINIILLLAFAIMSLIGVLNHEIWMDEAHHWLLARDSNSLYDLWKNTRYEGHPLVWNLTLFLISRFTTDPLAMQLTHWIISVTAVAILIFYSPFPRSWKILLVFSYFIAFEYTVISRNYSLMLLLFFNFLRLYPNREKNFSTIVVTLLLLGNTHLFGLILTLGIVAILLLDNFSKDKPGVSVTRSRWIGYVIITIGILLSIFQISPPSDSPFKPDITELLSMQSIERFLAVFLKGFLPFSDISNYNFWNTNLFNSISKIAGGILSLSVCAVVFFCLWRNTKALILFYGFTLPLLIVVIVLYPASIVQASRHFGMVFIVFIGCLWIIAQENRGQVRFDRYDRFLKASILLLLVIQVAAATVAYYFDLKFPFSESKNVAEYLRVNKLENYSLISWKVPIPSIASYAEKKFHVLPENIESSFIVWRNEKKIKENISEEKLIQQTISFAQEKGQSCILITHEKIKELPGTLKLLQTFSHGIVKTENFFLYSVSAN